MSKHNKDFNFNGVLQKYPDPLKTPLPTIYEVCTYHDYEPNKIKLLGYATGANGNIERYFDDQKNTQLILTEIKVIDINYAMVTEKQQLIKRKKELEYELAIINKKIQI